MVNCPKCGFSQPQDQYCANCGVDMTAYRPKEKPLLRRLLSNVAIQILFISAVVFSVFLIVRHQQRIEIAARIAELERTEPTEVIQRTAAPEPRQRTKSASPTPRSAPVAAEANTGPGRAGNPTSVAATGSANTEEPPQAARPIPPTPSATPNDPAETAPPNSSSSIRMSFNEVPRQIVAALVSESSGSYGGIQYGVIQDWSERLRVARSLVNWRSLDSTTPQSIKVGETTTVHRGPRNESTGEDYGLWVFAKLVRMDEATIVLQLELSRVLPNPNATGGVDQFNRLPLPELSVPRGGAAFVTGLVPHRPTALTANEVRLYRNDRVLQVLTSEPFRSQLTDFVVFVEPTTPSPSPRPSATAEPNR